MTNSLLIYEESGYLFNDATKRLEWFEIDKILDQGYNLCFLPGDKIEDLTMDETDGFVDTTGIVTSIKSKDVVEFYVENPFVKIKDE